MKSSTKFLLAGALLLTAAGPCNDIWMREAIAADRPWLLAIVSGGFLETTIDTVEGWQAGEPTLARRSLFVEAMREDSTACAELALDAGMASSDRDVTAFVHALMAAPERRRAYVEGLLAHGLSVTRKNEWNRSALDAVLDGDDLGRFELIARGIPSDPAIEVHVRRSFVSALDAPDDEHHGLHLKGAWLGAHVLEFGGDPREYTDLDEELLRDLFVLRAGAAAEVDAVAARWAVRNDPEVVVLAFSAFCPQQVGAKLLAAQGAAVLQARDSHGWTALHAASDAGRLDIVRGLLELGAAVDVRDELGVTAFLAACWAGALDVADLLVAAGADEGVEDHSGVGTTMAYRYR